MLNKWQQSEFDQGLLWCRKTWSIQCTELDAWAARYACTHVSLCHLMLLEKPGRTRKYPRLLLIHILFCLGSWEQSNLNLRQKHSHAYTHSEWEHMMHAGQIYGAGLWTPSLPGACLGSSSIFSFNRVPDAKKPILSAFPPQQPSGSRDSLFLTEMINVHANYQSMGMHSNMGDANQETVIRKNNIILPLILLWQLLSQYLLDTLVISPFISRPPSYATSFKPLDILYILFVLVVLGTRANWGEESFPRALWRWGFEL